MTDEAYPKPSDIQLIPSDRDATDEEVIAALQAFRGNVSKAAAALGRSRTVLSNRVAKNAELASIRNDIREGIVDLAEDNIFVAVEKGDLGASNSVVMMLGKNRGWTNKMELTGADDEPLIPPTIIYKRYEPKEETDG